ncbi:plasma kallikrein [Zootoca vivipara]|uniref:plasma kallikrein n=1 Tax=Zootoca vivipara TaxID=8524 RepID=UPI00293BD2E1|nr:plasma kallikrein [Zootoca vivipara]
MAWISQTCSFILLFSSVSSECVSEIYENTYFEGGDISKVYAPNADYCQMVCTYHPKCLLFSYFPGDWVKDTGRFACFLKETDTQALPRIPSKGVISGHSRKQCPRVTACSKEIHEGLDMRGENYNITTEDSYDHCQKRCTNENHCHFFTYTTASFHDARFRNKCYLKYSAKGTPTSMRYLRGVMSGFSLKACQLANTECRMDIFQMVFSGVTVARVLTPDAFVCRTICTYNPGCLFFTFYGSDGDVKNPKFTCQMMKSRNGTPESFVERRVMSGFSLLNCRSATPACHFTTHNNLNFLGEQVKADYVKGIKECQQLCTDTVRCQFFTYDPDPTLCNREGKCKCYLRMTADGAPNKIVIEAGKVSGYSLRLCQVKDNPVCVQQSVANNRIVGGTNSSSGEWPWQVSLHAKLSLQSHLCGGSIISDQWIVTAAHCAEDLLVTDVWRVYAGILKQSEINKDTPFFRVQEIIVHPKYELSETGYDIALMKLDRPMNFSALQQPICLPSEDRMNTEFTNCWVTGWGYTKERGEIQDALQKVSIPLISNLECQSRYQEHRITDEMMCAGYREGGRDACKGDSGGPLSCKHQGSWYLVGVTSWGEGCARAGQPGVYTNVAKFVEWILEKAS